MSWRLTDRTLELEQPVAAGIVNVTVDSMFEGARSGTPEQAVADGLALVEAGFEMLDVGAVAAEGGPPVTAEDEAAALVPAIEGLAASGGPALAGPISADTFSVAVARRALAAGAVAVNDISGGSEEMFELVAESGCGYVLMHIEGPPRVDRPWREYDDVVDHLRAWFEGRVEAARELGVGEEQIAIDPGLDFDLSPEQDLEILRRLGELRALGLPLYVSLSRKDFIGAVLGRLLGGAAAAGEREWGTVAAVALAVREGADILRIHDRSSLQAMRVAGADRSPAADGTSGVRDLEQSPSAAGLMARGGSLLGEPWAVAIDPARRDGRIVAESSEAERRARPVALPDALDPGLVEALRRAGIESLYSHQLRGLRGGAPTPTWSSPAAPPRARASPSTCRSSTASPATPSAAPSTSTRPRRWPRTRRASWRSCARRACARRSTTATRRARSARRSAAATTSSSPTRTCSTSASCPTTRAGATSSPTSAGSSSTRPTPTAASSAPTSPTCCGGCGGWRAPTAPSRASCSPRRRSPTRSSWPSGWSERRSS